MANLSRSKQLASAQRNKCASEAEQDRQRRLSNALRENLLKRKQQSRSRQQQQRTTKDSSAVKITGMLD